MANSLKKLLRKPPTDDDLLRSLEEVTSDGPRGAAILGATLVENQLKLFLVRRMRPDLSTSQIDEIFTGTAPLATFSSRIKIGYALGLYGPKTRSDLDGVRELRNAFAHGSAAVNFDAPEIVQRCGRLSCAELSLPQTAREKYVLAVKCLLLHLAARGAGAPGIIGLD